MRRNMSGNLGLYKYLWPGSVYIIVVDFEYVETSLFSLLLNTVFLLFPVHLGGGNPDFDCNTLCYPNEDF